MTTSLRRLRRAVAALLLLVALLLLPDSTRAPTTLSLMRVESAHAVDPGAGDGVLWVLAIGSDARPPQDVLHGNADAIELIAVDARSGAVFALGIPRDSWVRIPGAGLDRINKGFGLDDGPQVVAGVVARLTGVRPQYVLTTGFDGFAGMVDAIGGVDVRLRHPVDDPGHALQLTRGHHHLDGRTATAFARARLALPTGSDFDRIANQQALLRGILRTIVGHADRQGFVEAGAAAALAGLDTDLSPGELYRLAQTATQLRLDRVTACVLDGTPATLPGTGASIVHPDRALARRLAQDASDDARLTRGCEG